jgi:Alpha/beta hydrolase domain
MSSSPEIIRQIIVSPDLTVTPVPITESSKPFLTAQIDLQAHGYIEEEFFVSGLARAYEWVSNSLQICKASELGPYTTRVLVWRPVDAQCFSGNIEFEVLNASNAMDVSTTTATCAELMMRQGDVWVGFTSKPLTLNALRRFDPVRYAALHWSNPTQPPGRCAHPSIIPKYSFNLPLSMQDIPTGTTGESEDGLVWDIYAQLAALLKSDKRDQLLPGFAAPRIFATGYSQSSLILRTFISGFHNVMRLPGGKPVFDGYLAEVGPAMLRINQCSEDVLPEDPRNHLPILDVPVIHIVSEGDLWLGVHTRQADVVRSHSGLVTYEIAGAAHKAGTGEKGRPTAEEVARAGVPSMPPPISEGEILNDLPRFYLSTAALRNLQAWALDGVAPPQGKMVEMADGVIVRDVDGNALGGVRNPWIDVPVARYEGNIGLGYGTIFGRKFPFSVEKLRDLYPSREDYVAKVKASVECLTAERWLLPEDTDSIMVRAAVEPLG